MTATSIPNFIDQCVTLGNDRTTGVTITSLYSRYLSWAQAGRGAPITAIDFATAIRHQAVPHDDTREKVRFYPGLALLDHV